MKDQLLFQSNGLRVGDSAVAECVLDCAAG
jgi:hypothetical protein